jgi:glycosyltransferase involved in cell wall biosynthesis
MKLEDIGVYIICYNEEHRIQKALESVRWAGEIIIVDSFSTDKTLDICAQYTHSIYKRKFAGYGLQKNYALSLVKKPWALNIDSDEIITDELRKEIEALQETAEVDGYFMKRKNFYLGKAIRYCGWYPDHKLRLHKRDKGNWKDALVHESCTVEGKTGYLYNELLHYTYHTVSEHIERMNNYAQWSAETFMMNKKRIRAYQLMLIPTAVFVKKYIIQLGFLAGYRGMLISIFESYYTFMKYAIAYDKRKQQLFKGTE